MSFDYFMAALRGEDPPEDTETTETEGEAPDGPEGLTGTALDRLLELGSRPDARPSLAEQGSGEEPDQESETIEAEESVSDAGRRNPARRTASVQEQFESAVLRGYRDESSRPRSAEEAFRRKRRGVTAFDIR